jgi:hypothetical protein
VKIRAIPNQCPHICDARPLGHLSSFGTPSSILPPCRGFTGQTTLVNLEVGSGENAQISWDAITRGEGDQVTWDNLICKDV